MVNVYNNTGIYTYIHICIDWRCLKPRLDLNSMEWCIWKYLCSRNYFFLVEKKKKIDSLEPYYADFKIFFYILKDLKLILKNIVTYFFIFFKWETETVNDTVKIVLGLVGFSFQ